ncbi:ANTAR domain-containing protein [Actinosynnema sp. ALI-1.44]|uniref:ANTAR domain-containing protein n=1 Tax=Actinosynnema sp. ALI-1.44 TaxID=1933779 RepID=UPI001ED9F39B|nr:ANTAR domain-containing protein [Actinosynnema sp. ALI-1.44]
MSLTEAATAPVLRHAELAKAIDRRDVTGRAQEILTRRRGIPADEAFGLVRRASRDLDATLAE